MKKVITGGAIFVFILGASSPLLGCMFDTDCYPGSKCVKPSGSIYGVCAGGTFPGNTYDKKPVYDSLDPNEKVGATCTFDVDCGPGNRCLKPGGAVYGVCVRDR